ncbi:hypothetical protein CVT25_014569 [Psilocybe cyanescens]|uniref:Uncharacterized protein n=1 Tax=Psilocybe cyanescens TaxID=93625 RepID=A0A409WRK0_PSICY|nr:hypothetical protein CVT25_014569 [Psilocybe cyanescens]
MFKIWEEICSNRGITGPSLWITSLEGDSGGGEVGGGGAASSPGRRELMKVLNGDPLFALLKVLLYV